MGRITSFSKQVIVFFLVTALIIRPTFASNVGGWTLSNPVAHGASVVYTGTKNIIINGADYIKKGTVKITPTASQVAKVLRGGVAGVALSIAVEQLIGANYSWWLEGDFVKYKVPVPPQAYPKCYNNPAIGCFGTAAFAASAALVYDNTIYPTYKSTKTTTNVSSDTLTVTLYDKDSLITNIYTFAYIVNPAYDPDANNEEQIKSIPLVTVAAQVISNAEGGDQNAQVATMAAAADIVDEATKDDSKARPIADQLNNSSSTSSANPDANANANIGTGSVSNPNTADPDAPPLDLTLKFPIFCNWAPSVCEAAQVVISFPQTLTDWWNTGKAKAEEWSTSISEVWTKVKEEYADKPEENTDTELDIPDLSDENIDTDISFNGYCPAPLSSDINFMGLNKTIEFSFYPVCQIAEFIKPVVISISAFSAALIVAGIRTEDD